MAGPQALVMYGEGSQAYYYEEKNPIINREGIKVRPILVAPSKELIEKYKDKLEEEDLDKLTEDGKKALWVEYPVNEMDWLNKSKGGSVLFIWCAFDGSETPIMRKKADLLELCKAQQKMITILKAYIHGLEDDLEYVTSNQTQLAKKRKEFVDVMGKKDIEDDNK